MNSVSRAIEYCSIVLVLYKFFMIILLIIKIFTLTKLVTTKTALQIHPDRVGVSFPCFSPATGSEDNKTLKSLRGFMI